MTTQTGPQPWFGCDTNGEEWRRYCEAFGYFRDRSRSTSGIGEFRGWEAAMILEHDIETVRADYAGKYPDRTVLQELMRWHPKPEHVARRTSLEKSKRAGRKRT
jgi:hypothetical protein